jgi:hypothetical protein
MSGGAFQYEQDKIDGVAWEILRLVETNSDETLNSWGSPVGRGYSEEVLKRFADAVIACRRAACYVRRVDWLVSCDDGEDSFLARLDEELRQINEAQARLDDSSSPL